MQKPHGFIQLCRHIVLAMSFCFLTSCIAPRETKEVSSSTTSWFDGVQSVKNLGGYPAAVRISWPAASKPVSKYLVYSLVYDPVLGGNTWKVIDEVDGSTFTVLNSGLSSGQVYSYMVRAVDTDEEEDTNSKQLSTVAFDGIVSAAATGSTTAAVGIGSAAGAFDEIRIYAQPSNGGAKKLVATAKGQVETINVTGLHSGVKYKFSAQAYMSYLGAEDGNEYYIEAQTTSESFGTGTSSDYAYRGVIAVQALGDAPNAPVDPKARQVSLTWVPFNGATPTTRYRVVRATTSFNVNTATTVACTSTTTQSCVVSCTNMGATPQTCVDTQVGAPPLAYNYVITLLKTDANNETWAEELPVTGGSDFYIKVHIPSQYMVLIQRDAANYDMCRILGSTPNPRKHNRCAYSGIAATPYNTGPGKAPKTFDSGYYDFGYNLFVDRYKMGCNWTRNSASCGPNGCIGIPVAGGSGTPSAALGSSGDVYFALNGSWGNNCYFKQGASWVTTQSLTNPADIRAATTIDPGVDGSKHNPQFNGASAADSFRICQSHSSDYGNKRLLRRREHVHAAAFATIPGEPNAVTDKVAEYYLRTGNYNAAASTGGQLPGYYRCTSSNKNNQLAAPTSVADMVAPSNTRSQISYVGSSPNWYNEQSSSYFIGTISTSKCVSRWGSQDPINSGALHASPTFSDSFLRTNDPATTFPPNFVPVVSDYDSGVVYDWAGYAFDGIIGIALGTSIGTGVFASTDMNLANIGSYPRYIAPLGVPLITNSSSYPLTYDLALNGTLGSNSYGAGSNSHIQLHYNNSDLRYILAEGSSHRFSYSLHQDSGTTRFGTWCAVEAE